MDYFELFRKACITYSDEQVRDISDAFAKSLSEEDIARMKADELYVYDRAIIFLTLKLSEESEKAADHVQSKL